MSPEKIFIDTADIEDIKTWNVRGIVDGVTTNKNIFLKQLEKEGYVDFEKTVVAICKEVNGPVSVELTRHDDVEKMVEEAEKYAGWHKNVVIKVPMTPDGIGLDVIRRLSQKEIKTNATIMMTAEQLILAAKAGATYVSIFYNRARDVPKRKEGESNKNYKRRVQEALVKDPQREIRVAKQFIQESGLNSKIIAGSLREPKDISAALEAGADIVTIPGKILVEMLKHPMTDITIVEFDESWEKFQKALKAAETAAPKPKKTV